ncbi:unnamed protein product, partial [Discosporangium mesarthrocarpum]
RGKTFVAKNITRHLNWLGIPSNIFNAGNFRRKVLGSSAPSSLFDPSNKEGQLVRQRCVEMALDGAIDSLQQGSCLAVLDATNSTRERRQWLQVEVQKRSQSSNREGGREGTALGIYLVFLELTCDDDARVWNNVKDAKLHSPDYAGWKAEDAMQDFYERIGKYRSIYEPCSEEE